MCHGCHEPTSAQSQHISAQTNEINVISNNNLCVILNIKYITGDSEFYLISFPIYGKSLRLLLPPGGRSR